MLRVLSILYAAALACPSPCQTPDAQINPTVKQIVDAISEQRIAATLKKLEGFGTRYILSAQDDPVHGIGAAKRWIHDELQSYSPRLQVSYQDFSVKKGARRGQVIRDVDLSNIVAVLPGNREGSLRSGDRTLRFAGHGAKALHRRGADHRRSGPARHR